MKRTKKGSITVEAALVMPIVLGVIFLLYTIAMIQYENITTRAAAMRAANRVAFNWNTIGNGESHDILSEDMRATVYSGETAGEGVVAKTGSNAITSAEFEKHDPYRFFTDLFPRSASEGSAGAGTKIGHIYDYLTKLMKDTKESGTEFAYTSASAVSSNSSINIFHRYVTVTIDNTFTNPILELLNNLGFHVGSRYQVTAKAKLTEPAEFIRNLSFIEELIREK